MSIRVERYAPDHAGSWNAFVASSKNGLFLFDRGYMDYHADRFADHSLIIRNDDAIVGLLPASARDGVLTSHGGLTFGGVICDRRMRTGAMIEVFAAIRRHMSDAGLARLLYKAVPHIYHQVPSEEDLYALFRNDARMVRRDVSSTIDLRDRVAFAKGRKWSTAKALKNGLEIAETRDFAGFMLLEAAHLQEKFGVTPTHTGAEMELLAGRFPENIRLFTAHRGPELLGGVVIYQSRCVAHAQYIASTAAGRELGALDAILDHVLRLYAASHPYFDFGISTEQAGRYLNAGLVENKESYGGRATVHDFYDVDPA